MKRKCIKFLSGWLFSIVFCTQAIAGVATPCGANETNCWVCGDDCTARLDSNGKLSIYGSGEMYDYNWYWASDTSQGNTFGTTAPWFSVMDRTTSAEISGVSSLGSATFLGFKNLTDIDIGDTVTSIGDWSLEDCNFSSIYIPPAVTSVGSAQTFTKNPNLIQVITDGELVIAGSALDNSTVKVTYEQKEGVLYLYDRNGNVKGIFASQSDLKDAILENGQARIEYGEDNSFTVYNKNGEITGKWDSHGDVIARYIKGSDGSVSIYDKSGKLIGIQGKRILTVDEATALVSGKNTFKLKYR